MFSFLRNIRKEPIGFKSNAELNVHHYTKICVETVPVTTNQELNLHKKNIVSELKEAVFTNRRDFREMLY